MTVLLIAAGGALGALLRWWLGRLDGRWPAGTLAANGVGCLLAGVVLGATQAPSVRALLLIGVAGGLTTFSTWVVQAVGMSVGRAAAYLTGTVLLGVAGVMVGTYAAGVG